MQCIHGVEKKVSQRSRAPLKNPCRSHRKFSVVAKKRVRDRRRSGPAALFCTALALLRSCVCCYRGSLVTFETVSHVGQYHQVAGLSQGRKRGHFLGRQVAGWRAGLEARCRVAKPSRLGPSELSNNHSKQGSDRFPASTFRAVF